MISVIVCTRNRSASLRRTLDKIKELSCPEGLQWEVIVVDNNSTDDTRAAVESFSQTSGLDVQYVFEGNQGQSYARNAGMRKARGEIVAFTDDDVFVDREWLLHIAEECSEYPSVAMFFGQTRLARPNQAKLSIREGDSAVTYCFPCNPAEPGCGNNMILRKSILSSVEGFDPTFGPGTKLPAADDIEFTFRVLRSGGTVRYCPKILVYHDHDRLTPTAVRSLLFNYGIARGGYYCKHVLRGDRWATKMCYWEICGFLRGLFRKSDTMRALIHLTGMVEGFFIRSGTEIKALLSGTRVPGESSGEPLTPTRVP
jgi:glycosyltransferase involved in cell wall biosynthesis